MLHDLKLKSIPAHHTTTSMFISITFFSNAVNFMPEVTGCTSSNRSTFLSSAHRIFFQNSWSSPGLVLGNVRWAFFSLFGQSWLQLDTPMVAISVQSLLVES
ncbi:hypothetical protein ILYODFUR_004292 [Ilyodon furcidens]|uniref:Uncharacterized protein n=1 Tax=Ilyodon furcidens TaxID=33524 RepID=A0ABV0V071_9TELE